MKHLYVVGMGPGGAEYILPAAAKIIDTVDIVCGAPRHLALFPAKNSIVFSTTAQSGIQEFLNRIELLPDETSAALLVTGDPCLYSLLNAVKKRFPRDKYTVIPGLSSFQLAFAQLGLSWENAVIVSVHGKKMDSLDHLEVDRPGIIFLDAQHNATAAAAYIAPRFGEKKKCIIANNMGYPEESLIETTLEKVSSYSIGGLCILIIP